jgi:hypothetical protein
MQPELAELWADFWPLFLACAAGSVVTAISMHLRYGRRTRADYRAGASDMEKLIRDRAVVDFRDKRSLEDSIRGMGRPSGS